jgi:hypothetical protein
MADLPTQKNRLFARTYTEMNGGLDDSQEATTGKIGGKLWAIFDPAEDNNLSQRRNANGGVITFPTRQHVRVYLKEQMAAERVQ